MGVDSKADGRSSRRLRELDALRGLAALAVVLFHLGFRFHELFPAAGHVTIPFPRGDGPVLVFFAISGFAMLATLDRVESVAGFAWQRFARLFPAYWAALGVTLAVTALLDAPASLRANDWQALVNLTMLQDFLRVPPVDGAYWSLSVELGFYGCIALLWRIGVLGRIERIALAWLILRLLLALAWPDIPDRIALLLVLPHLPWFVIGMAMYRVWQGARRWSDQAGLLAAAGMSVAVTDGPVLAFGAVLVIAGFWLIERGHAGGLVRSPLVALGGISYPLYLVHQNVGYSIMLRLDAVGVAPFFGFGLALLAALALATVISRLIEWPAQRALLATGRKRAPG
jgi:peptidoglycan/LPS O-acetylase OafA/YrhL